MVDAKSTPTAFEAAFEAFLELDRKAREQLNKHLGFEDPATTTPAQSSSYAQAKLHQQLLRDHAIQRARYGRFPR